MMFCQQVFAIIRSTENPQMFAVEFIRGATKKFMSTERYCDVNKLNWQKSISIYRRKVVICVLGKLSACSQNVFLIISLIRDSLLASLLDGVRASGNRDVCVKVKPTNRGLFVCCSHFITSRSEKHDQLLCVPSQTRLVQVHPACTCSLFFFTWIYGCKVHAKQSTVYRKHIGLTNDPKWDR